MHDNDDWPEPVTVGGLKAWQFNPLGRRLWDSVTVPLKLLRAFIAMVDTAAVVPSAIAVAGVAVIVKSGVGLVTVTYTPV